MRIPPSVGDSGKITAAVGAAIGGFLLLMFVVIFAASTPSDQGIPYVTPEDPTGAIPAPLLAAYQRAGSQARIPWTILAAVGELATTHGRFSPYDSTDRDPGRPNGEFSANVFPEVLAPIGDSSNPREALGPVLLWPELVSAYAGSNPQSWDHSLKMLTAEINRVRAEKGMLVNELVDPEAADAYWAEVMSEVRAGRPNVEVNTGNCLVDATTPIGTAVSTLAWCAFDTVRAGGHSPKVVTGIVNGSYTYVEGSEAGAQLVEDIYSFAQAWAGDTWNASMPLEQFVPKGCGGEEAPGPDEMAGIIPHNSATAKAFGISDRCDVTQVVTRTMTTVARAAAVAPEKRDVSPATDGWHLHPWAAAGWDPTSLESGGGSAPPGGEVCDSAIEDFFGGAGGAVEILSPLGAGVDIDNLELVQQTASELFESGFLPDGSWDDPAADYRSRLEARWLSVGGDEACGDLDYGDMWFRYRAATGVGHPDGEEPDGEAAVDPAGAEVWAAYEATVLSNSHRIAEPVVFGTTPAVARFAGRHAGVVPGRQPTVSTDMDYGTKVVATAVRIGGLFAGDLRGGQADSTVTMEISLALTTDRSCGPRDSDPCSKEGHITDASKRQAMIADGRLLPIDHFAPSCGHLSGYAQPRMAELFGAMCEAAAADGVKIGPVWAERTSAQQAATRRKNGCASATSGSAGCSPPTASVGSSYHEWGLALDISTSGNRAVREWMHAVVACYAGDIKAPDPNAVYTPLPRAYSPEEYVKAKPCGDGEYPVKKANTFGLVFAVGCTDYVDPRSDSAVLCKGGRTEDWHAQPGIPLSVKTQVTTSAAAGSAGRVFSAATKEGCYQEGRNFDIRSTSGGVYDRQKVAQLAYAMFECVLRNSGYANQPPSKVTRGDGSVWDGKTLGFDSYATQVAAEAVVVGYCESGYTDKNIGSNNFTGKYGGVFQMGDGVASGYGPPGANKFDPVDNIYAAAGFYVANITAPRINYDGRFDGWWPWAVVNTDYGGANEGVKIPVVARFTSSQPGYVGEPGVELPAWAIDPFSYELPTGGCPYGKAGGAWPPAKPLAKTAG